MRSNSLLHSKDLNMVFGVGVGVYPLRKGDTLHHRTVIHIPISHHYTATQQGEITDFPLMPLRLSNALETNVNRLICQPGGRNRAENANLNKTFSLFFSEFSIINSIKKAVKTIGMVVVIFNYRNHKSKNVQFHVLNDKKPTIYALKIGLKMKNCIRFLMLACTNTRKTGLRKHNQYLLQANLQGLVNLAR